MKTSYFARLRTGQIAYPVSISRFPPRWYKGPKYLKLAPTADMLARAKAAVDSNSEGISNEYQEAILAKLSADEVVGDLQAIWPEVDTSDITLLCFEALNKPCHRHLAAQWLTQHGYPTEEMSSNL